MQNQVSNKGVKTVRRMKEANNENKEGNQRKVLVEILYSGVSKGTGCRKEDKGSAHHGLSKNGS